MAELDTEIIGQKIKTIRAANKAELATEGWDGQNVQVIVLENGVKLYSSRDYEGNGPGALFGHHKGKGFAIS